MARLCQHILGVPDSTFEGATRWHDREKDKPRSWQTFKRLAKTNFYVLHRGKQGSEDRPKRVDKILDQTPETYRFEWKNRSTGQTKEVSVKEYFKQQYNVNLNHPYLPLVQVKQGEVYPMELCIMCRGQQYKVKLNEDQTSKMIKFAATRPKERKQAIAFGLSQLDWQKDPFLKGYGMKINPNMLETNARILEPPEVQYGKGGSAKPMFSGRWDLRGKIFSTPNPIALKSWGVLVLAGSEGGDKRKVPSPDNVQAFIQNFLKIYRGHGGRIENPTPHIVGGVADTAQAIQQCFQETGNKNKMRPHFMMIIVTNKSADVYNRVKRNCDCRFGIMSQVVQSQHVMKNAPQYCSNVLMKVNLKMGGTTCTVKARQPYFKCPTMIIGADVTHASPGTQNPSIAAITVSMDRTCSRYAAFVQTNGFRTEMITQENIIEGVKPLIHHWMTDVNGGNLPIHVYYFRDGVSEGQYIPLIQNEVADLKKAFLMLADGDERKVPRITVVVAEKRHHIRFFPSQGPAGDKNGNPVPGLLVDRDVTHPFEEDIYLNSHVAIQGTSRPTHYHMIFDEYNIDIDQFQTLLYEHCYQYQRATTPVSLFPAVYYAHLAAARAVSHINLTAQQSWAQRHLNQQNPGVPLPNFHGNVTAPPELTGMEPTNRIRFGMWYI